MRRVLCVFLLPFLISFPLEAQSESPASPPENTEPVPYEPDEFPEWSRKLRRAEIITLGLFPFAFLFSSLAYDVGRYSLHGFDSRYAPGPFGSADKVARSDKDTRNVIFISISLSAFLAIVDLFIEESKPQKVR